MAVHDSPAAAVILFRWTQADQALDDELRDHLERKTEEYVAQGMTQEEAHRRARLNRTITKLANVPTPGGPTPRQLGREQLVQLRTGE